MTSKRKAVTLVGAAVLASSLAVQVEPAAASAPINQQARLIGSGTAEFDSLGYSVAISGDTAVVGAPLDDTGAGGSAGSAYVFTRGPGATWTQQQQLFASDGAIGDEFGHSVAISGNTIVVGAHLDDTPANGEQGSAYVFVRSGTTWTQQAHLFASDAAAFDEFGGSVGISGNTVVVGAAKNDTGAGSNAGSVYVYTRSGTTWTEATAQLTASDDEPNDRFGSAVAIDGNKALIGASFDDVGAAGDAGSAYIFNRPNPATAFTEEDHVTAGDALDDDHFGASVALFGTRAVVGAPDDDTVAGAQAGSAYVFTNNGAGIWDATAPAHLFGVNASTNDRFGNSVAIWGTTIVVGAYQDNTGAGTDAGSVYVFVPEGGGWIQKSQLFASDAEQGDQFGVSVAISQNTAIAGADLNNTEAGSDAGAAYVFAPNVAYDQWQSLGGAILGRPDVAQLADGSLMYFATGIDRAVWMHRVDPDGNSQGWSSLGGQVKVTTPDVRGVTSAGVGASNAIAVGADPDSGRVDIVVRGMDDAVWLRSFNADGDVWAPWETLGGIATSEPSAMAFGDPDVVASLQIEIFVRGNDNALWRRLFDNGAWGAWNSLGGTLRSAPGAGGNATEFLGSVAVRGVDNAVWYKDYRATTQGFSGWISAGGVVNAEPEGEYLCTPTLFGRGTDNGIWTKSTNPDTSWGTIGAPPGGSRSGTGTHEMVFNEADPSRDWIASVRGTDNALWTYRHRWVPDDLHCLPTGDVDNPDRKPPLAP